MTLPDPDFFVRDPQVIEQEVFAAWESLTNSVAQPGTPEEKFLRVMSYRETLLRIAGNETAKQNLLRYARFPAIDFIGELIGVMRLAPQRARTTMRITLPAVHAEPVTVVAGTRRKSRDGAWVFETIADATIPAGQTTVDVQATCTTPGPGANGYVAGQIDGQVDALPLAATMANTTTSANGTLREEDARLLERILLAPTSYSTAGPEEAYRYHALSASAAVKDVSITSPEPGLIVCYALADGVPDVEVLTAIAEKLTDDEKLCPMSDTVEVEPCIAVDWALEVTLTLYADVDEAATLAAATQAAEEYRDSRQRGLGRDLVPSQIKRRVGVSGVYDLEVVEPPNVVAIGPHEWARCTGITVTVTGTSDEKLGTEDL